MPYPRSQLITWTPGTYYHIYNRGVSKTTLFRSDFNFRYVLRKAVHYCRELDLSMIAYCLMKNHYHFLTRQDGDHAAGLLPQRIFNGYTKAYNRRYGHSGTLFERRYQIQTVESYAHLLHLCRYIHANPVIAGFVDDPGGWPYSNYLEWTGERDGELIDKTFVTEHFDSVDDYEAFVWDYIRSRVAPEDLAYAEPNYRRNLAPLRAARKKPDLRMGAESLGL